MRYPVASPIFETIICADQKSKLKGSLPGGRLGEHGSNVPVISTQVFLRKKVLTQQAAKMTYHKVCPSSMWGGKADCRPRNSKTSCGRFLSTS